MDVYACFVKILQLYVFLRLKCQLSFVFFFSGGIKIRHRYRLASMNFCDRQKTQQVMYINVSSGALQVVAKNAGNTIQCQILLVELVANT